MAHMRMTLVSAPAGAGKTTLLAELRHAFPETAWAWLLLDAEDNDPSLFAAALIALPKRRRTGDPSKRSHSGPGDARS